VAYSIGAANTQSGCAQDSELRQCCHPVIQTDLFFDLAVHDPDARGPKTNESMARIWFWKSAETLFLALETKL